MAKARIKTKTVVRTRVLLSLTEDEAATLLALLGRVAGDPVKSPRRHADSILDSLYAAGVSTAHRNLLDDSYTPRNSYSAIRFVNFPDTEEGTDDDPFA